MAITLQLFLHEMLFNFFDGNFCKGCLVKIFAENFVMWNSVQIGPEFPAKSLSVYIYIYMKNFPWRLSNLFNWKLLN